MFNKRGTKGDNQAVALGGAKITKAEDGSQQVEVDFPNDQGDINNNYQIFVRRLAEARPANVQTRDAKTKQEDYFREIRTRLVLFWLLTNTAIIIAMTNQTFVEKLEYYFSISNANSDSGINPFLSFIFYSVLGISAVRFVGSTSYLIHRALFG